MLVSPLPERHRQEVDARLDGVARPRPSSGCRRIGYPRSRVRRVPLALPLKLPTPLSVMFGAFGIGRDAVADAAAWRYRKRASLTTLGREDRHELGGVRLRLLVEARRDVTASDRRRTCSATRDRSSRCSGRQPVVRRRLDVDLPASACGRGTSASKVPMLVGGDAQTRGFGRRDGRDHRRVLPSSARSSRSRTMRFVDQRPAHRAAEVVARELAASACRAASRNGAELSSSCRVKR